MNTPLTHHQPGMLEGYAPDPLQNHFPSKEAQGEQFGLRDFIRLFERHKLMIISIVAVITLGTLAMQLLSPSIYRSVANVQIELLDEVGANQADVLSRNAQRVANEVKLHRSRSSAERVVKDLNLLENPAFLHEIGRKKGSVSKEDMQMATTKLASMAEITAENGSDLIEIAVSSRSPELSALIANQYPESVRAVRTGKTDERRLQLLVALTKEQERRAEEAREIAQKLADYRRKNEMLVGAGGAEDLAQINRIAAEAASASALGAGSAAHSAGVVQAANIRSTAGATSAAVQQLQRQQANLTAEQAKLSSTFGANHPDMVRVTAQLGTINTSLAKAQRDAAAAAASIAAADGARMAQLSRSDAARDAVRARQLNTQVSRLTEKAYRNTSASVDLDRLAQESNLADKAYAAIAERVEAVRARMQLEGVTASLVSPAVPNNSAISPAPLKITFLAFLGSGLFALLIAFSRDLVDDKLRTAAQIRRLFQLPTLGMLPMIGKGLSKKVEESLVIRDPQSIFAEAARSIYSEVRELNTEGKTQSVLITSPLPGDGKSTVALTIAAAAIAMGDRAVVLDLDLRKPGLLQKIQTELNTPDLLDILAGRASLDHALPPPRATGSDITLTGLEQDEEENRIIMLSAKEAVAEPATLLNSNRMRALMAELREKFDLIVVNAPATLAVRDARTMCDYTDYTLMVARWGATTIDQMRASLEILQNQVSGVVFDQVDYAEHARRCYGDSIQYYMDSSSYYTGSVPPPVTLLDQFKRIFRKKTGPA